MTGLADKRVAVIGTGATGIQCVPHVARDAEHLFVVQRTPSTVDVRGNRPTDPEWAKTLKPGWQRERMDNFLAVCSGQAVDQDLVHDGWTDLFREFGPLYNGSTGDPLEITRRKELGDLWKGEKIRARVDRLVEDPPTAEALKPWYGIVCKRPTFNDDFLPTFNRRNVTLLDTQGRGLDAITERGLVFNGAEIEADCIVFATGFEVGTSYTRRAAFEVTGRGDVTLSAYFANGIRSFHGFYVHGFPNFFMVGLGQNGFKANFTDMIDEQCEHLVGVIAEAQARGATRIEATYEAEEAWGRTVREKSQVNREYLATCTPGYYSGEGDLDRGLLVETTYGGGPIEFTAVLREWRASGGLPGLSIA
jgi:cyclohexanone monooxygenase